MTIEQLETQLILRLKKDYDTAINDRNLWKAEAERWREIRYPRTSFEAWWTDHDNGCPTLVLDNDEEFARAVWNAAQKV